MAKLVGINDLIVNQYVRVVVVVALQNIFDIIDNEFVWAISLVGDRACTMDNLFSIYACAFVIAVISQTST